jgi:hypothetical protein
LKADLGPRARAERFSRRRGCQPHSGARADTCQCNQRSKCSLGPTRCRRGSGRSGRGPSRGRARRAAFAGRACTRTGKNSLRDRAGTRSRRRPPKRRFVRFAPSSAREVSGYSA